MKINSLSADDYLLPFLRARKYQMERVFVSIEKDVIYVKQHPEWTTWKDERLRRAMDLYDTGFYTVMMERDNEGRRIILCNNTVDLEKFNGDDIFCLGILLIVTLYYEEETQISGAIFIIDFRNGISLNYLKTFSLRAFQQLAAHVKYCPIRIKKIFLLKMPSIATALFNIFKFALTEKMSKRLFAFNDIAEILDFVETSLFPIEENLGGKISQAEMIADFKMKMIEVAKKRTDLFDKLDVNLNASKEERRQSFKKLEID